MSVSPSRRRLLQATALLPVAACTSRPSKQEPVDPDVALREAAVARERALIERYRAAASSASEVGTRIAGLAEQHEEHLAALGASTAAPSASAAATAPAVPTLAQLVAAERAAAGAHAAAALTASRPLAEVLASLAASEAAHVVVLA